MGKPTAYIFDVDGTLANVDSILHHLTGEIKDFDAFHSSSVDVEPHWDVVALAIDAANHGHHILVVTARKEKWRAHTSMWLALHSIPSNALFMRNNQDGRADYEVKCGILHRIRQCWDVVHAVDDNPHVIRLWQEQGIPTTKIGDWDGN